MIAIIDYGAGNLFSVQNALNYFKLENKITSDKGEIVNADRIILPGVGAFGDAMEKLNKSGLVDTVKAEAAKKPFLGICLGMQLLFEKSFEFGEFDGLGLIKGSVKLMKPEGNLSVPQMGWNALEYNKACPLLKGIQEGKYVYFVHSYAADCDKEDVYAYADYGGKVPALVGNGTVYGAQFHPEKSGDIGLSILRNFAEL
ncbi:MAG: imidazole glycerol phosphate synthase subunit HisH [Ruminococcaceae bacterium]|nr:imidazole glycerol phosphate synthase subunit HisH [Oscillospiraceae bacterium]